MGFTSSCCGLSMRPMSTRSVHVCPCGNEFSDAYVQMTQHLHANTSTHTSPQVQTYSSPASPSVVTCEVVTCGCGCVYYIMPDSTVQCNCGTQHVNGEFGLVSVVPYGSVEPVKKEKVDDAEERLRAKLIPKFNHEDRCNTLVLSAGLQNAPKLPWFGDGTDDRTMQSKRQLKRWTATNLVSWPVCRHARVPLELEYHEEPLRDDPYGGSYCRMRFYCKECGR